MPNIIIRDIDYTTANTGAYNNFTVVIPGLVKNTTKYNEVADDYGIYQCSSLADFKDYIGIVDSTTTTISATPAKLLVVDDTVVTVSSAEDFYVTYYKQCYTQTATSVDDGYLAISTSTATATYGNAAYAGTYTLAETFNDGTVYYVITTGNEGNNELTSCPQIGNQLAYEWISAGGTVLYKKFSDLDELVDYDAFWAVLADKSNYDFRYIIPGFSFSSETTISDQYKKTCENIETLAANRMDCTALIDIPDKIFANETTPKTKCEAIAVYAQDLAIPVSKYTAYFAPTVEYSSTNSKTAGYTNTVFPATFHYLICSAEAQITYPEYFAAAGLTRGKSSYYLIKSVGCVFGEMAVNYLTPRTATAKVKHSVNLISKIRNNYYIEGNRTAHLLGAENTEDGGLKASHFLNIRQLCSTISKQLYINCQRFQFDPNSSVLWTKFCGAITPLLDNLKANQGIEDYKILKVRSTQKAELKAVIRIVPIEAVEDFNITLSLEDSLTGTLVNIDFED